MKDIFSFFKKTSKNKNLEEENFKLKAENERLVKTVDHLRAQLAEKKSNF